MITEDYVSFETAKLLKEKGFDGDTFNKYADKEGATEEWYDDYRERMVRFNHDNGILINPPTEPQSQYRIYGHTIPAPTLQMAMKWLREVQGLNIYARGVWKDDVQHGDWEPVVVGYDWFVESLLDNTYSKTSIEPFLTYEEACEAAIKYCLENLI